MPQIFWDASALAKRYYTEIGTEAVDAVFAAVAAEHMTMRCTASNGVCFRLLEYE